MKIETFKLNTAPSMLVKAQPMTFKNNPVHVIGCWPATAVVSFAVDDTKPGLSCNAFTFTSNNQPVQGGGIVQIGPNLYAGFDCFA